MSRHSAASSNGCTPSLLEAAVVYNRRGWSVIPVKNKKAAGVKWTSYQTTRPDEPTTKLMFGRSGVTGLAVIHGSVSGGLVCRDFDDVASYYEWVEAHPDLAKLLPTVRTQRGFHVYFRGPEAYKDFGNGEYRGDSGHYTLLPPSAHPEGGTYTWFNPLPEGDLPTIDPVKAGLWGETERTKRTEKTEPNRANPEVQSNQKQTDAIGEAAGHFEEEVRTAIATTLPTAPRQRNRRLFELARKLKAIPQLASAKHSVLRPIVLRWHHEALPVIGF